MRRSTALEAEFVWSVPKTRRPVSAAWSAIRIVSRSRSSPTRIASGSSRSAAFSAAVNVGVSGPSSRCVMIDMLRDVDELDRVLDRDDVVRLRPVDPVDESGERRRLARAGRPGDRGRGRGASGRRRPPAPGARGPPPSGRAAGSSSGRRPARAPAGRGSRGSGPCRPSRRRSRRRPSCVHSSQTPRGRDRVEEVLEVLLADRPPPHVRQVPVDADHRRRAARRGGGPRPSSRGRP